MNKKDILIIRNSIFFSTNTIKMLEQNFNCLFENHFSDNVIVGRIM